jgi:hypothetical protein
MSLSRLQNFLNSPRGTVFSVDANALDATDSIENRGTSQTRPFRTIQRALAEVARFSYQRGVNNDRFGKSTILVAPGTYIVDNRPGAVVRNDGSLVLRNSGTTSINEWDLTSNFDLSFVDNDLYQLNSVHGGLIVPRGCSIIGADLRKVKIIPLYVPNPENEDIERSAVFRVTGASFLYGFSILDSDPNGNCYKDYTRNQFVPNFSHHKLTAFEYADGVNPVIINDEFQSVSTNFTDLEMFYDKIARVYGESSGRPIDDATYGATGVIDIEPIVDEYRIVGSRGREVGITSIRAGDGGVTPSNIITVTIEEEIKDLSVDSPIEISGVGAAGYNGQFVVSDVVSSTEFEYRVQNVPVDSLPGVLGATLNLTVDTVTSASPYIFNVSLRSVYGMCGLHADGAKADGFKSMVVAQFTGIGLQKDDNAFVIYDNVTGSYRDSTTVTNLHTNSRARFKPEYENYHIKASNNSFLQLVSIFAIGYAQHFLAESGADYSITNSNSNFGAKALIASGFRDESFEKDDVGYITHIIPPQELETEENSVEFLSIDVGLTTSRSAGAATTTRLYLYQQDNLDEPPVSVIDGYRIGAKQNEVLRVQINQSGITSEFSSNIVIPGTQSSYEKSFNVAKAINGENLIDSNSVITLTANHNFQNGETVRVVADNGHLPDGLQSNQVYYVITNESKVSLGSSRIELAQTLNNAILAESISFNKKGGQLKIVSRVTDKSAGDIGHPIQWDTIGNWYINVSSSNNGIYDEILLEGTADLGEATSRTYVSRRPDNRNLLDTLYRFRYVIPKDSPISARPPLDGYVIQEPSNGISLDDVQKYFSDSSVTFTTSTELRNLRFISNAVWSSNSVTITAELPHDLRVGTEVEIENIIPSEYNGTYTVTEIVNSRQFKYSLNANPGVFNTDTTIRTAELPVFKKKTLPRTYQVYRTQEIKSYIPNEQDGVYHLIVTNSSNSPTVTPFRDLKFNQPIQSLYPQTNRDNPVSDPNPTRSFALPDPIGQVVIDNPEHSLSKETLGKIIQDFNIGFGITSIVSDSTGIAHTIFTSTDHGLSGITDVSIVSGGSNYITGTYYAADVVGFAGSTVGSNASVKVIVGGAGTITSVEIMHGGSAYGIGNTLSVIPSAGIGTTTGFTAGVVQVTGVFNNLDDSLSISGVGGTFTGYNTVYRVTGIQDAKLIQVESASNVIGLSTISIGSTVTRDASAVRTGKALQISSFEYNATVGLATIGFSTSHGLLVNNKIRLGGFDESYFNRDVVVKRQNSLVSVVVNVGKEGVGLSTAGTAYVYRTGYTSNAGVVSQENENLGGRLIFEYGGITSNLTAQLFVGSTSDQLVIANAVELGFKIGDYLQVNNEVFRIRTTVTSNTVSVFRSLFGSRRESHDLDAVVRKINVTPIGFRRNSIIRASGHTFEYVGFGPGNYSTALPERQDRILSPQEELIAQSTKENGGIVIFTAMNSDGDFYTGNKKINSATGQEEVFNTPIPTVTGEELNTGTLSAGFDVLSPLEATFTRSIRVEGGPKANLISEFDGPVVFNNKITAYADIEGNSIFIQGDEEVSREISISNQKPLIVGNYGDVKFNSSPENGGNAGWIYTTNNEWKPFGWINDPLYGVGVSTNNGPVGFSTLLNIVGIGLTITKDYDSTSGVTTVYFEGDPVNTIGLSNEGVFVGEVTDINFVGEKDGFSFNISIDFDSNVGLATITFDSPISIINFGDGILGYGAPSFATTSIGTRIIYEDRLNATNTNYAVGIGADDSLWWSVPQNNSYAFKWYGGTTEIASLLSNGVLTIVGDTTSARFISTVTTGTEPISVASSTLVTNLNANYLEGFVSAATTTPNTIVRRDASNNINGNASHLRHSTAGPQRGEWYSDIPARLGYFPFNRAGDTCSGDATFNGLTTIKKVSDIYVNRSGSTLTCDFNDGPITRTTSTNTTIINITNVPTTNERALNYTVVMNAGSTVSNLANIQFQINGTALNTGGNSIRWLNNLPPSGTAAGYYFFGFSIFRVGSVWEVISVFATYA